MAEREVGARHSPEMVEVAVLVAGTLWWLKFEADEVLTSHILEGGRGVVELRAGRDCRGPVRFLQAKSIELIIRRPIGEKESE